jgi:hypothetical protein
MTKNSKPVENEEADSVETDNNTNKKTKKSNSKLKCVWNMGTDCSDDVQEVELFKGQIKVPICSKHVEEHKYVMILHKNGYDVEEILQQTPEYRKGEVLVLKLAGLAEDDIEL